ncbi:MAG: YdeI family protein [Saprospiraceae bacterium]
MDKNQKVFIETPAELKNWLVKNHRSSESVWLVKWKKDSGKSYFGYDEMVDELIAFGWVDSLPKNLDAQKTMHRISPRNPKSNWSKVNKERVKRLSKEGRMHVSGINLVEGAKENGAWNFLDDVEKLIVPPDLEKALKAKEKAKYYYERFPNSSKRNILEWIKNAKQSSTRQRRIEETANKAAQNIKANHPKGRDSGPKE